MDRNELGMFLVQAGLAGGRDHALAGLLALNGLRISEALDADIEHLGMERAQRTLTTTRKGGKIATIPLAPRMARTPQADQHPEIRKFGQEAGLQRTCVDRGGMVPPDTQESNSIT